MDSEDNNTVYWYLQESLKTQPVPLPLLHVHGKQEKVKVEDKQKPKEKVEKPTESQEIQVIW